DRPERAGADVAPAPEQPAGGRGGRGGGRGARAQAPAPSGAAAEAAADDAADAQAAAEVAKAANEAAKSDLDLLAHALKFKSAEYLLAKPKARAGDVAFRAPRRVGPEATGAMTALH